MSSLSLQQVLIAIPVCALIIFATRLFPFALFSRREPPKIFVFIEKYIPPMVMAVLVVYCVRFVTFFSYPFGIPEFASLAAVIILHLYKNNALLSILGGTILFMTLQRFF